MSYLLKMGLHLLEKKEKRSWLEVCADLAQIGGFIIAILAFILSLLTLFGGG